MTGSVVQDMASGGNIALVNTAWSENHQSNASQQYRGYDWETRDGQTHRARYEDNYKNRNQVDRQRPYHVHWGEPEYNSTESQSESMYRSRAQDDRDSNEVKLPPV